MQLGKALVGAIIGAAVGIAIMVVAYLAFSFDKVWLALPVAILTGLGVRMMVATGGHASYLRGALTGVLALGAYLLGGQVVATVMQNRASTAAEATRIERPADDDAADDGDDANADEETEEEPVNAPPPAPRPAAGAMKKTTAPSGLPTVDFIVLCVSALIAYELGRGTAAKPVVVEGESAPPPPPDAPQGTHPDA